MTRLKKRALLVVAGLLAAGGLSFLSHSASAHTCVVVKTSVTTIVDDPQCQQEADNTPPDHMCTSATTNSTTVITCIDR